MNQFDLVNKRWQICVLICQLFVIYDCQASDEFISSFLPQRYPIDILVYSLLGEGGWGVNDLSPSYDSCKRKNGVRNI